MELPASRPTARLPDPLLLGIAYFATFAGQSIWRSTFHNFAIETFQVNAQQVGFLFSLTGIPGVLAFTVGFVAKKVRIFPLLALSCTLVGLGLIWISLASHFNTLWLGVLSISTGFACFYPVVTSLCLLECEPRASAISIGRLRSFGPLAAIGSALLILHALPSLGFRTFLLVTGTAVVFCGGATTLGIRNKEYATTQGSLRLKSNLWPYYALNFLAGCRSALFKTFVIFLLVTEHHFKIRGTAMIVLAGSLFSAIGYRLVGQLANRFDQRNVLSALYIGVALIFLGFSLLKARLLVSILFLLDSLFFAASVVTDSYLKTKSAPQEVIGDVASGLTLFYLGGILAPLAGGILWEHLDHKATFLLGSGLAVLSILTSRYLDHP
jgi:predicted MFS family arabinose efflux permease